MGPTTNRYAFGSLLLATATLASLLLALPHFDVVELPGCGVESACAAAAGSRWGSLPLVGWPTSFLGLAYFEAMLAAWILTRGRLPRPLLLVIRAGAAVSLLLLAVILVEGFLCVYCLAVHAANLCWVAVVECARRREFESAPSAGSWSRPLAAFASTFALTGVLLVTLEHHATAAARDWIEQLVEASANSACRTGDTDGNHAGAAPVGPGRYVLGPADAAHHVVVVSDYQCPSCRTVHESLRGMIARRGDLSFSARHFPFCTDCNGHLDKTRHANACRAAQAAEAAGLVGGSDAFWKIHDWLFDRRGQFSDDELAQFATQLGLPPQDILHAMQSAEVLAAIRDDTRAAHDAGLRFTPMIFLDGAPLDPAR